MCLVMFFVGAGLCGLLLIYNIKEEYACDYTGVVETCNTTPAYMEDLEFQKAMVTFNFEWMNKAQALRMEAEEDKCTAEENLVAETATLHEETADRIIRECQTRWQACVKKLQETGDPKYQKFTFPTTTLQPVEEAEAETTTDPYVPTTEPIQLSDCEEKAKAADPAVMQTVYTACISANEAMEEEIAARQAEFAQRTTTPPPPDCSRCDSFCRSFDWLHLNPEYGAAMNYTGTCGPKVCPWMPECGWGPQLNEHCSAIGCKCEKAKCHTTTTTARPRRALGERERTTTTTTRPRLHAPPRLHRRLEEACNETMAGPQHRGYRGCQSRTRTGRPCQKWTKQPEEWVTNRENQGLGDHNYCRNPDGTGDTIWCYPINASNNWEYCDPKVSCEAYTGPCPSTDVNPGSGKACPGGICDQGGCCEASADSGDYYPSGTPPPDGIVCESTSDCPSYGACAENPVCWTHESPNEKHYCAEQVTPGNFGTSTDACEQTDVKPFIQCFEGKLQRYCREQANYVEHKGKYCRGPGWLPPPDDMQIKDVKDGPGWEITAASPAVSECRALCSAHSECKMFDFQSDHCMLHTTPYGEEEAGTWDGSCWVKINQEWYSGAGGAKYLYTVNTDLLSECQMGEPIEEEAGCVRAATAMGKPFKAQFSYSSSPMGCISITESDDPEYIGLYWNTWKFDVGEEREIFSPGQHLVCMMPATEATATCSYYPKVFCASGMLVDDPASVKCADGACRDTRANDAVCCKACPYGMRENEAGTACEATCICEPGLVDMVIVGRPFKVFFADSGPNSTAWNDPGGNKTGRRLDKKGRPLSKRGRVLSDIYNNPESASPELGQGIYIEMEEWRQQGDHREFACSTYFSDRYKYVYPRTVGEVHSYEALVARLEHPDLGCGYEGFFKVTCDQDPEDATNCTYNVDISTCQPPNYQKAVDSCFGEQTWSEHRQSQYIPEVPNWLAAEKLSLQLAGPVSNFTIKELGDDDPDQCCEEYVGSECVRGQDYHGAKDGAWAPEQSYSRETGYFPIKYCKDQAKPFHRPCPMAAIKELPSEFHEEFRECDTECNLTMAQAELMSVCDSSIDGGTKELEERALRDKVGIMKAKRSELNGWSRTNYPMVHQTTEIVDCVDNSPLAQRYSMMSFGAAEDGFDKLKLKYMCRLQQCSVNQCLKIQRTCDIPQMSTDPELTCGPFGDPNMYSCEDKVAFQSSNTGEASQLAGMLYMPFAAFTFLCSFWACFQTCCLKKRSRVVPLYLVDPTAEKKQNVCKTCGEFADSLLDDVPICEKCLRETRPEKCRNCGADYDDPDDNFCSQCSAPRQMMALPDTVDPDKIDDMTCKLCGEPLGHNDGKCPECGWHVDMSQDAIVLRADTAPLRANAQSAANEHRIVPVGTEDTGFRPIVGQE